MGHTASAQSVPSAASWRLITLNDSVRGSSVAIRTNAGHCLGPRSGCSVRNSRNASTSNVGAVRQQQRRHHLIPDIGGRYPVHGDLDHVGVTQQHPLDRRRAEVLAVDAHPVAQPPREVRVAVLVAVSEVAAVVDAAAPSVRRRPRDRCSSPRTVRALGVHDLTRDPGRARLAGFHVDDLGPLGQRTQRARRGIRCPADRHSALGGTESVDDDGAEPARRSGRRRRARPRSRIPPAAGCRRRRDAPVWPARTTAACRRSWRTSRRSAGRRAGTATQRTCAATPSSPGRPTTPPTPPAPRSSGTTASTHSRCRRVRARIARSSSRRRSRPCRGCRSPPWGRHWYPTCRSA